MVFISLRLLGVPSSLCSSCLCGEPLLPGGRVFDRSKKAGPPKGPEPLGEILSRVFTARGWGRRQDRLRLERAWADAIGPEYAPQTRLGGLRRGVLEVEVLSGV